MSEPEIKQDELYQLLRHGDMRGVDFSHTNLEGASINGAKISGTLFPKELRAEEILLSLQHGTRMRYTRLKINLKKPVTLE